MDKKIAPSQHVLVLICILREKLTFSYNLADMQTKCSQFHEPGACVCTRGGAGGWGGGAIWRQSQVEAHFDSIKYKLNLMSSPAPSTVTFTPSFTTIIHPSISLFPPPPPSLARSLAQVFLNPLPASIFFSLHPKQPF